MILTVIGSTGRTGRLIVDEALRRRHAVTAFSRRPAAADPAWSLQEFVVGDGRDSAAVARAIVHAQAVLLVVSGGSRADPHAAADVGRTVVAAMAQAGVQRLVVTSAYPIVAKEPRFVLALLRRLLAVPYADMRALEEVVSNSRLDWTIVRLNRLTDGPATGHVEISTGQLTRPSALSRADAADVLLDIVETGTYRKDAINVSGR